MQVKKEGTITGSARRMQIVKATIATIAELGYHQASFARIAERARLSSTRLISYHFDSKDELMSQVIATVHGDLAIYLERRVGGATTAREALDSYIRSTVAYVKEHPAEMRAATEIHHHRRPESPAGSSLLERLLARGRDGGEFAAFDTRVMAMAIHRTLDGLPLLLDASPGTDLDAYADEVAALYARATGHAPADTFRR